MAEIGPVSAISMVGGVKTRMDMDARFAMSLSSVHIKVLRKWEVQGGENE